MTDHQMRSQEVRPPDGQRLRVVTWYKPASHAQGDWRGALTWPVQTAEGTQTVYVCGEAYASTESAVTARCVAMARIILGMRLH